MDCSAEKLGLLGLPGSTWECLGLPGCVGLPGLPGLSGLSGCFGLLLWLPELSGQPWAGSCLGLLLAPGLSPIGAWGAAWVAWFFCCLSG